MTQEALEKLLTEQTEQLFFKLAAQEQRLDAKLGALEKRIDDRFDEQDAQFHTFADGVGERFEAIDQHFKAIDQRLESIDTKLDTKADASTVNSKLNQIADQIHDSKLEQADTSARHQRWISQIAEHAGTRLTPKLEQ